MKHLNKFNENKSSERYFLAQDQDSHWYMIPLSMLEDWRRLNANDTDDEDLIEEHNNLFYQYRTNGGYDFSFENPKRIGKENEPLFPFQR